MPKKNKPPAYRKRSLPQGDRAYVTLRDIQTRRSKDYNLGIYGSSESRELYARLIADWEKCGRRLAAGRQDCHSEAPSVAQLCLAYWQSVEGRVCKGERQSIKIAIRVIRNYYGTTSAINIGPNALRKVRDAMVAGDSQAVPPRKPWPRGYINMQIQRLRRMFKWAVSHEMLPATVYQALTTLEPLKRGHTSVYETAPVMSAPENLVSAARQHVLPPVAAMIDMQLITGMRPGEVAAMRSCDIDMTGRIWLYQPQEHKTAHHGKVRTIYLGPKAQRIIRPFLSNRPTTAYLFSPVEAVAAQLEEKHAKRTTPLSCGNRPGTNRKASPRRSPRIYYTTISYGQAINRACDKAFPPPEPLCKRDDETNAEWQARLTAKQKEELKTWWKEHRWHPHQLRHNYATNVRRQYGLEAAQILLGHSSALITDAVYAERDMTKAQEIVSKIG